MVRNLYRFYLYIVFLALLVFATIALGQLLRTVLLFVPLFHASYETVPNQAQVVQSLVFALVSCVIAGLLGGLHYWLIRRDIASDPSAGNSAIRSFFLNMAEAMSVAIGVPFFGFAVLGQLTHSGQYVLAGSAAFAFVALVFAGVLELERRRTQVTSGAALAFQRLHLYGVQVLLLILIVVTWQNNINTLIDAIFFGGEGTQEYCGSSANCQSFNITFLAASILWFVLFWLAYGWLTRTDTSKLLRFILHFASVAVGVVILLVGLYRGVLLLLLPVFKIPFALKDVVGPGAQYDFATFILLGVLVTSVYHLWLTMAAKRNLIERGIVFATEISIAAILTAFLFWSALAFLLYNELRSLNAASPEVQIWAANTAAIIVGLFYIPLNFYLRRRNSAASMGFASARRGFVLAVLGGSILSFAIGGAVALYAWTTSLFSSPIANWLQVTHSGLAAFIVGGIVSAFYLTVAIRERFFGSFMRKSVSIIPASTRTPDSIPSVTIEGVLDELLVGRITRDDAAQRIRDLEDRLVGTGSDK